MVGNAGVRVGTDWIALSGEPLPVRGATEWAKVPGCGAVVSFVGCVRDHSAGRPGVVALEYEAYEGPAVERIGRVVAEARRRWPAVARIAILHRVGRLSVTEDAVVVVVSSPHRAEAFGAAEFCIDTVKETAPIWKRERWATGEDWGICDHDVRAPVAGHPAPAAGSVGIPRAGVPAARDGG